MIVLLVVLIVLLVLLVLVEVYLLRIAFRTLRTDLMNRRRDRQRQREARIEAELDAKAIRLRQSVLALAEQLAADRHEASRALTRVAYLASRDRLP